MIEYYVVLENVSSVNTSCLLVAVIVPLIVALIVALIPSSYVGSFDSGLGLTSDSRLLDLIPD